MVKGVEVSLRKKLAVLLTTAGCTIRLRKEDSIGWGWIVDGLELMNSPFKSSNITLEQLNISLSAGFISVFAILQCSRD